MKWSLALPVAFALLLAGCAADPSDDPDHGDHGDLMDGAGNMPMDGTERMVHIIAGDPDELRFDQDRIEVRAGQRVGVMFHNEGETEHEFAIKELDFHLHAEPGGVEQAAFIAPGPGEYEVGCYVPGHFEGGMKTTLVVS